MQKLKNNSSSNGNNCKLTEADAINFSSRLQASYKSSCACEKSVTHFQHIFSSTSSKICSVVSPSLIFSVLPADTEYATN